MKILKMLCQQIQNNYNEELFKHSELGSYEICHSRPGPHGPRCLGTDADSEI